MFAWMLCPEKGEDLCSGLCGVKGVASNRGRCEEASGYEALMELD